ncbi:MAG: CoA transferase subunit A [Deltaproteobacteria bacterium]|nr:CoA transferase subunit A [Deltaproteobacteria bacterium]
MKLLEEGQGELLGWHDPDENRRWVLENKSRKLEDKRCTVTEAVERFVHDEDFIASGGFGHVRVSMAVIYEIIRQAKRSLKMAGKTAVHDADLLIASGCVDQVEVAYTFGHELRGLSPASRRMVQSGRAKVVAELSNAVYQWRFMAGMMGLPFLPTRNMLGTDTLRYSSCKVVEDPFTKKPICLVPACYPDVTFIHVPRADRFGNCQIDGIVVEDFELSRCARRVIITTEKIIPEEEIRAKPDNTVIPYFVVDAVVEVPFGSHPCEMPYLYYFDEEHIAEWLTVSKTDEGVSAYMDKYVHQVPDFAAYLELVGGQSLMERLGRIERYEEPMVAPWRASAKGGEKGSGGGK